MFPQALAVLQALQTVFSRPILQKIRFPLSKQEEIGQKLPGQQNRHRHMASSAGRYCTEQRRGLSVKMVPNTTCSWSSGAQRNYVH